MYNQAKISTYKIGKIISHFCIDITASKTAALLDMNRNTINHWYGIFRKAIYAHQMNECKKIFGEAELDESYFGARRKRGFYGKLKRDRGTIKQPVFGVFERNGRVYTESIPDCKKRTLRPIIQGKVSIESILYTDGWRGYNGLVDVGYGRHFRVNHGANEFSKGGGIHINGIESFWSFTKRRLAKFNGTKRNFDFHLKECEWRWKRDEKELKKNLIVIAKKFEKIR